MSVRRATTSGEAALVDELVDLVRCVGSSSPEFFRVGAVSRVALERHEGRAQSFDPIGGHIRSDQNRARNALEPEIKLGHLAISFILDQVDRGRDVRQIRCLGQPILHNDVDLLLAEQICASRFDLRLRPVGWALDLATLHGEQDIGRPRIAADDLGFGANGCVEEPRRGLEVRGCTGAASPNTSGVSGLRRARRLAP